MSDKLYYILLSIIWLVGIGSAVITAPYLIPTLREEKPESCWHVYTYEEFIEENAPWTVDGWDVTYLNGETGFAGHLSDIKGNVKSIGFGETERENTVVISEGTGRCA